MNKETLDILNDLSKRKTTDLALSIMELTADNLCKDKEIKRLNNILNELEKYIEQIRLKYCNELVNQHNCIDLFIENSNKLNHIVNIKLKLKELRGDKDE